MKSAIEIKSTEKFSSQRDGVSARVPVDDYDDDGDDIDRKNMTKIQRKAIRVYSISRTNTGN